MYYVFLQYNKGYGEKDFRGFRTEEALLAFLMKNGKNILIQKIFEVSKEYKVGLIELPLRKEKTKRGRPPKKNKVLDARCLECDDLKTVDHRRKCKKPQYVGIGLFNCRKYPELNKKE